MGLKNDLLDDNFIIGRRRHNEFLGLAVRLYQNTVFIFNPNPPLTGVFPNTLRVYNSSSSPFTEKLFEILSI